MKYIVLFVFFVHCSSFKNYSKSRVNDLADIVNIGFEREVIGAKMYFWIGLGLWYSRQENGYGLRFGHFGEYKMCSKEDTYFEKNDGIQEINHDTLALCALFHCSNWHIPLGVVKNRNQKKIVEFFSAPYGKGAGSRREHIYTVSGLRVDNLSRSYAILPIEITIAFYYGIRLGFNPHELLDFIVGIFGFDLLNDDTTMVYAELPIPFEQNRNWEKDLEEVDIEMGMRIKREREEQARVKGNK